MVLLVVAGLVAPCLVSSAAQANPVPQINQPLAPAAAIPGGAGFTLTVTGTGFVAGSVVNWNGSARATQFISRTRLSATIPASDITAAGTAAVTVVNPPPGGGKSDTAYFTATNPTSLLTLAATDYVEGGEPVAVAVGDFNGDGKLDLAITNSPGYPLANNVSILLGNGDGTFQAFQEFATGGDPVSIAVGDFNGDGKLDLAVANLLDNDVSILLGNGDGTFRTQVTYSVGGEPHAVVAGDFNGDGNLDLAVANIQDNSVSILLGKGDGTFQPAVNFAAGLGPFSLASGDLNGDGKLDLAVGDINCTAAPCSSGTVSILLGNGDGSFQAPLKYVTPNEARSVAIADFNGDGRLDLAVAIDNCFTTPCPAGIVSVFLGNGDGTLQPRVDIPTASELFSVMAVDLNGDGKLDLAITGAGSGPGGVSVLFGNGDGTFQGEVDFPQPVSCLAMGDFNGDGRLDLAVPNVTPLPGHLLERTVTILLQSAIAQASPASLDFGTQNVGVAGPAQTVTLANTGSAPLLLQGITLPGADPGDFSQTNTCGASLASDASCTITVEFAPTAFGDRSAALSIADNASGSPQTVALKGHGKGPDLSLSPSSLSFGDQVVGTSSTPQTVTLTSDGVADLLITGISATGLDGGDFAETNTCGPFPAALAPTASCTISVTFAPVATGTRVATLMIDNNAGGPAATVSLSGTARQGPRGTLSPASATFASQAVGTVSPAQVFTLASSGDSSLTINGIAIVGVDRANFAESNNCGALPVSLAPSSSCTVSVTFAPTTIGMLTASLSVTDNAVGSPQTALLQGPGADFSLGAAAGNPMSTTITAGQTAIFNLNVNPVEGLSTSVTFTCSGAPPGGNCEVTPNPATLSGSTPALVTISVLTMPRGGLAAPRHDFRFTPPSAVWVLILLLCWLAGRWLLAANPARPQRAWSAAGIVVLLALAFAGCGMGGGSSVSMGTPRGAYPITVTGRAGQLVHSTTMTLIVN